MNKNKKRIMNKNKKRMGKMINNLIPLLMKKQ